MKLSRWMGSVALMTMLGVTSIYGAPVQTVHVDLQSTTGTIPSALQARMVASIQGAASYIYEGKEESQIQGALLSYKKATVDVVDRILYGYTVKDLSLQGGQDMTIHGLLEPYGKVMNEVYTTVHYGNLSPYGQRLIEHDIGALDTRLEQILLGASLDSLDWITPLAQKTVRTDLEGSLPEFTPQIQIQGGAVGEVTVYLVPNGDSIGRTDVRLESNTLPSALFYGLRQHYEERLRQLEGLPVSFVRRHILQIERDLQDELNGSRWVTQFGITMTPKLEVNTETILHIHVDSSKYILRGEGYLDMGKKVDSVGLKLYTGVHRGRSEWYLETEVLPNRLQWIFKPTYTYQFSKDTRIGYQYSKNHHRAMVYQTLGPRWKARYERNMSSRDNEFALSYDVHEYLRLEYIWDEHSTWLRLIGRI